MTWNIHGSVGLNPRFDLARVVDLIKQHHPDVIALQEVDSRSRVEPHLNPFAVLQRSFWMHGIGAVSIVAEDGGEYGQMLISRYPLRNTEIHDISLPRHEPRKVIKTCVETPSGPVEIIATHLGLGIGERRNQTAKLLKLIEACQHPAVVLGDFNDWFWQNSVRKVLEQALPGRTEHRTFPARLPLLRLDRIFFRPANALKDSWIDTRARGISDHVPVIADLEPYPDGSAMSGACGCDAAAGSGADETEAVSAASSGR